MKLDENLPPKLDTIIMDNGDALYGHTKMKMKKIIIMYFIYQTIQYPINL